MGNYYGSVQQFAYSHYYDCVLRQSDQTTSTRANSKACRMKEGKSHVKSCFSVSCIMALTVWICSPIPCDVLIRILLTTAAKASVKRSQKLAVCSGPMYVSTAKSSLVSPSNVQPQVCSTKAIHSNQLLMFKKQPSRLFRSGMCRTAQVLNNQIVNVGPMRRSRS